MQGPAAGKTRAIVATSIGNMLEWYDFTVYALFAPFIARNFFPASGQTGMQLVETFLVFGLGFVVRPLGAVLIGHYGDRAGRKPALILTTGLMGAGTAVIAFAPTYASLGMGAPLLLLCGRLLQGFSAGGEVGGATAYLLESAEPGQRGRIAAWLQASMGLSNILGALVALAVSAWLSPSQILAWGWRLPFLAGLCIVPVGLYLRRSLAETEAFKTLGGRTALPLLDIQREHGRSLVVGVGVAALWAVAVYVLMIFMPTYVQRPDTFGFSAQQAFGASLVGNIPFVVACAAFGALSDRVGRRVSLLSSAAALLVCVLPLFAWLKHHHTTLSLVTVQSLVGILVAGFAGVAPAALSEIFPARVRATGTSVIYNLAFTVFGGFAPTILTWITLGSGGSLYAPAWYVMLAAAVALAAIPLLPTPLPDAAAATLRSATEPPR